MSLSRDDVAKVAKLSRIRVEDAELDTMQQQLNHIFGWIEQLQQVDTEGVEPMAGVGSYTLRVREDVVTEPNQQEKVLSNAPKAAFGCYSVPKVVE